MSLECRMGCGACCIAPSISSPIPGMPEGKPAGVRCVQLDEENLCKLFGSADRPIVCGEFTAEPGACGTSRTEALTILRIMEQQTSSDV